MPTTRLPLHLVQPATPLARIYTITGFLPILPTTPHIHLKTEMTRPILQPKIARLPVVAEPLTKHTVE